MAHPVCVLNRDPPSGASILQALRALPGVHVEVVRHHEPLPMPEELLHPSYKLVIWNAPNTLDCDEAWARRVGAHCPGLDLLLVSPPIAEEEIMRFLRGGISFFLEKPFDLDVLGDVVARIFRSREVTGELPADCGSLEVASEFHDWFEITAPSHAASLERFTHFARIVGRTRLPRRDVQALVHAVNEIGQNAIEWGNKNDPHKKVCMSFLLLEDRILLKIQDEGQGFAVDKLEDPTPDPYGHLRARLDSGKRVGGYGICMVKALMDEVLFSDTGSTVILTKYLRSAWPSEVAGIGELRPPMARV